MLRARNLGFKFRRQAVIGQYIVDFVSFERKLIIWLIQQGYIVLRFWNNDVLNNRDEVLERIVQCLSPPSLTLPTKGEGN